VDYVKILECETPSVESLYHRLCAITHPSNASISWIYEAEKDGLMKLSVVNDETRITELCDEFPNALQGSLGMCCNVPLLILHVLHKFGIHPKIPELRPYGYGPSKLGQRIKRLLEN
jgi:hypothetical protein